MNAKLRPYPSLYGYELPLSFLPQTLSIVFFYERDILGWMMMMKAKLTFFFIDIDLVQKSKFKSGGQMLGMLLQRCAIIVKKN